MDNKHEPTKMAWKVATQSTPIVVLYIGHGWKKLFVCPVCERETWQAENFLGSRQLVCDGLKIKKIKPEVPRVTVCPKCGGPMTEGNFESACKECDKTMFERCHICGALRIFCCC
jgi:uncharacterized protein (DUF2225 family)